jgi:hypothetical protein
VRFETRDTAVFGHQRDGPGDISRLDMAIHQLAYAREALRGQPHLLRRHCLGVSGAWQRDRRQG